MDVDNGESYKLLIIMELCIGGVGADVKIFTIIGAITLLSYFTNDAYTAPRLLAITPLRRIIFVPIPVFTIEFYAYRCRSDCFRNCLQLLNSLLNDGNFNFKRF